MVLCGGPEDFPLVDYLAALRRVAHDGGHVVREDEQVVHHRVERDGRVAHDGGHVVREDEQVVHRRVERDGRVAHDGGHVVREDVQAGEHKEQLEQPRGMTTRGWS